MEPKTPYYIANREKCIAQVKAWHLARPNYTMWLSARSRSRLKGWEFAITPEDIFIPEKCPILGIPLVRSGMANRDNSPSIDRISCAKGYILGNIQVISMRANRIKAAGTPEELMKIAIFANRDVKSDADELLGKNEVVRPKRDYRRSIVR